MELDLKDYIKVIRKRIWIVISFVIIAAIAAGLVSYLVLDPVYQASTKLIVNKTNDQPNALSSQSLSDLNYNIQLINTYKEVIRTSYIMDLVAKEYPKLNTSADELISKVKVSSVNNTQVMTLSVEDRSYSRAVNIVNAVSDVFQREIPSIYKVDNVSILDRAQPNESPAPVKPNPKLNIAIAIVVSLMLSIGLVFLLEYLDDTIKTEEDVLKYLELPTLAMISKIKDEDLTSSHSSSSSSSSAAGKAGEPFNATVNQ